MLTMMMIIVIFCGLMVTADHDPAESDQTVTISQKLNNTLFQAMQNHPQFQDCIREIGKRLRSSYLLAMCSVREFAELLTERRCDRKKLYGAVLDSNGISEIVKKFLDSTAECTDLYYIRDDLTAREAMDLYWRVYHSPLSDDDKNNFLHQLMTEVRIFRDLALVMGYPELFVEFHNPLETEKRPNLVPDYIINHMEQIAAENPCGAVDDVTEKVNALLPPPFNQIRPNYGRIAEILMSRLSEGDDPFPDVACAKALLHYGIQFSSDFVIYVKDPNQIAAFFSLLRDHEIDWIWTFRKLITMKKFDRIRNLLQVPAFIRVIQRRSAAFGGFMLLYYRHCWDADVNSIMVYVIRQQLFTDFLDNQKEFGQQMFRYALERENIDMIKALTSHDSFYLEQSSLVSFVKDDNVEFFKRLLRVKNKSTKMLELLELIREEAILWDELRIIKLFEPTLLQRMTSNIKTIFSRLASHS